MNNISIQDAVHKNVILWKLMCELDFWKVRISYGINVEKFGKKAINKFLGF